VRREPTGAVSNLAQLQSATARTPVGFFDRSRIDTEIEALKRLGLEELRLQWRNRWGRLAPAHVSRALLFRLMAYRIQAGAFGNLDRQTAKMLDRQAVIRAEDQTSGTTEAVDAFSPSAPSPSKRRGSASPLVLKPGTLLTREWQGRIERAAALEDGFAWNGKTYASLSAVAFAITGVKWNGHRFFFGSNGRGGTNRSRGQAFKIEQRKVSRDPASTAETAL
jgi:hypothetical protein